MVLLLVRKGSNGCKRFWGEFCPLNVLCFHVQSIISCLDSEDFTHQRPAWWGDNVKRFFGNSGPERLCIQKA
jgi:hypothetical protein